MSFHYTLKRGYMGDPNGLVYRDGIFHLFFQYGPHNSEWTPEMHWGHATSNDLLHWNTQKIALYPDNFGAIWSGSAIVDNYNVSGFGVNSIVCMYTSAGGETYESSEKDFTQSIAYSNDGISFTKYLGNPVLCNISRGNRDPKFFWSDDYKKFIMILYLHHTQNYGIFCSDNAKLWSQTQILDIQNGTECPDLFNISNGITKKWCVMRSQGNYVFGDFDGKEFTQTNQSQQFAFGDIYASQTFNNINNRNIVLFKLSEKINQMSIPIELKLDPTNEYIQCFPASEYLSTEKMIIQSHDNTFIENLNIDLETAQFDLYISFKKNHLVSSIDLIDGTLTYRKETNMITYNNYQVSTNHENVTLHIISDTNSIEIFVENEKYIGCFQHGNAFDKITIKNMDVIQLKLSYIK